MIPEPVRRRNLVGYGPTPPRWEWPDGARVVVNVVLVYEEGSEYSVLWRWYRLPLDFAPWPKVALLRDTVTARPAFAAMGPRA